MKIFGEAKKAGLFLRTSLYGKSEWMCGFFLVIQRNNRVSETLFDQSFQLIKHRGPDYSETRHSSFRLQNPNDEIHVAMGHHRLSILDLDERSNQPFERNSKSFVYNGELYNYRQLRSQLFQGESFETTGDTEVFFRIIDQYGPEGLRHANGMWSYCFLDKTNRRLIAGRDRYGKKPLFYFKDKDSICFSSSIQPILHYKEKQARVRSDYIDSFLMDGFLYPSCGSETYIENIYQVPNGSFLEFDLENWNIDTKQNPSVCFTLDNEFQGNQEDLNDVLEDSVRCRLVSDRNVALLLSGGIDSSLILSILSHIGELESVRCFIGDTGTSDDAQYAIDCAKQLGLKTEILHVDYGNASFDRFLQMCRHQEKPFPLIGNSMAMAEMYAKISEFDISVVLDGTGGDEVFGGYWDRYFPAAVTTAIGDNNHYWLEDSLQNPYQDYSYNSANIIQAEKSRGSSVSTMEMIGSKRASLPIAQFCRPEVLNAPVRDPLVGWAQSFDSMLFTDATKGRLAEWIWQNDRNAMMSSIENRSPFLDYRLFPYIGTGYDKKFVREFNKYELRKSFDAFQPLPTQWRTQKQGFRWVAGNFYEKNASQILEMIAGSKILESKVNLSQFLDSASKEKSILLSSATSKLLCISGLESTLGLHL